MTLLQRIYILILSPAATITCRLGNKATNLVIYLLSCILMCLFLVWHSFPVLRISTTKNNEMLLGCLLLTVVIIISINKQLKTIRWVKSLSFSLFLCAAFMLFVSLVHPIGAGFRATALILLFGFPCLYFVWGNRADYHTLYTLMAKGFSHILTIYFIACILTVPVGMTGDFGGRYTGTTANPNIFGMLCVAAVTCALYLISETKLEKAWLYMATVGIATLCALYSVSRTALLIIVAESCLFIAYYLHHKIIKNEEKIKNITILIATIVVLLLATFVIPYVMNHADTVSASEQLTIVGQKTEVDTPSIEQLPFERFEDKEMSLNAFSSSRLTVWKNYIENLNLMGHNGNKRLYIKDGYNKREWAHNTALEIAYRCGIIPGALFLFIEIYAGIYVLIWLFGKRYEPWRLFSMLGITAFCAYSVLDVVVYPFEHVIMFLFFIAIMPLFKKEKKIHDTEK